VKSINYKNKVSKILLKKDAIKELNEYELMSQADRRADFYLGKPSFCEVKNDIVNKNAIKKCNKLGAKIIQNYNDYSLIIMKDGGLNLIQYADYMATIPKSIENCNKIKKFWSESYRLLLGIKNMIKHNIVHHDLKGQNVVYSQIKNRCNFIDFGMMNSILKLMSKCRINRYEYNLNHWSFPFESALLNKDRYDGIKNMNQENKMAYLERFAKKLTWVSDNLTTKRKKLEDYSQFILFDLDKTNHETFMLKYFETMDIYGLGLGFQAVLDTTEHLITPSLYSSLKSLFYLMTSVNHYKRIEIDELMIKYEEILSVHNISKFNKPKSFYNKMTKKFNHDIKSAIKYSMSKSIKIKKDPIPIKYIKECSDGKIRNPITGRCNTKKKIKSIKECSDGKIRNPITGRCNTKKKIKSIKECSDGKIRNPITGRCNTIKKIKSIKECIDGKIRNPITGRCNKVNE
jgi:hypothetical protein